MTADPVSVELRTLRVHALRVMVQRGFRHLCVLDEDRIVGVFSMRELVRFVQDLFPRHLSSDAA